MNMKKNVTKICSLTLLLFVCFACLPVSVHAAKGKTTKKPVSITYGKTYKSYDITGNGKADKFKVTYTSSQYSSNGEAYCTIYVNGKKKKTITMVRGGDVYLMAPTSKRVYLAVKAYGFSFNHLWMYRYSGSKIKCVYGKQNSLGKLMFDGASVIKNTKSKFTVRMDSGKHQGWLFEYDSDARGSYNLNYKFNNGKPKLVSNYGTPVGNTKYYAWKSFYLSTSPKEKDSDGAYVEYDDSLNITRYYVGNKYMLSVEVETPSGEKGWIVETSDDGYDSPYLYR